MFFTEMCPSGGTKYVSFELFLSILREPGEGERGRPWCGTFEKPRGHLTEGMFEKCRILKKKLKSDYAVTFGVSPKVTLKVRRGGQDF